jgi:hypothetical protein
MRIFIVNIENQRDKFNKLEEEEVMFLEEVRICG